MANIEYKQDDKTVCKRLYDLLVKEYLGGNPHNFVFYAYIRNDGSEICLDIINEYELVEDLYDCYCKVNHSSDYKIESVVTLPTQGQRISLQKNINKEGQPYICIKIYGKTNKIHIQTSQDTKWHLHSTNIVKTFIIHDNGTIYTAMTNGKYYPSTVYDLSFMPVEMQKIMFSFYAKETKIWEDFITDSFYPSLAMSEMPEYYNKKDFLEKQFGLKLPKKTNARDLKQMYCVCCAADYIKQDQKTYLITESYDINYEGYMPRLNKRNKKEIAKRYISQFMQQHLNSINKDVLWDYIEMAIYFKEPIDIKAGKKKIYDYHNHLADRMTKKANRGKKLEIPESPLKYLILPKPFVLLKTKQALINEGQRNRNCVGGYVNKINQGKCVIYAADINDEHLTIEICYRKGRNKSKQYIFYVNQCYKSYNRPCKEENEEYVKQSVEAAASEAVERYNAHLKNK